MDPEVVPLDSVILDSGSRLGILDSGSCDSGFWNLLAGVSTRGPGADFGPVTCDFVTSQLRLLRPCIVPRVTLGRQGAS